MNIVNVALNFIKKHPFTTSTLTILLLSPLVLYFCKFNHGLSSDYNKWSAFGSYIGGVYGPILTLLSLGVLIWTLFQMRSSQNQDKEHFQIQLDEQRKLLDEQQKQKNIDDIITLTNMIRVALENNPLVNDVKLFYKKHLSDINHICMSVKPDNIQAVWNISHKIMKQDKYFDSEVHILGEILERIILLGDTELQKRAKIIIKGLIPQQQRFLFKSYAHVQQPKATIHLEKWSDFCHPPKDFKNYVEWFGKK
ncbi:hypothetical protein FCM30_05380 [Lelliottia aquatilis]|uniref:hypothetical protein n=1 Tax=Lelliottia aquatilis TaxID=2080838 RepID=UPI00157527F2|nr:hypothetical protein [Lelliottia aquatilis]NTZ45198.1 hypothetical protein [Lelliottia aquatilis]